VKYYTWDDEKNELLKKERKVSFEEVILCIEKSQLLDILEHPNQEKYPGQRIFIVNMRGYACLVPFLEMEDEIILKTIIPSRKATWRYLRGE
jgi:uncharacterized DUF497 family protein